MMPARCTMAAKFTRHIEQTGPVRARWAIVPVLAYLVLALQGGVAQAHAFAYQTPAPAGVVAGMQSADHDAVPRLPAPCCIEHECDALAAVGPAVPGGGRELLPASEPNTSPAIVGRGAAPIPARATAPSDRQTAWPPPAARPVYLTTARIRL